ncbi:MULTISPECIES: DUF938 domain-containing protein [Sphingobium]|uniref:SAM-dependent methyltransferase n=1 Tax=Sphingobium yanoikuyae ATCC 51230 TaxID=883163 RepID=K9D081_SPHYA|nr:MULTISPECIES: DUF938 domain-containing protein [Sphingobium]EKU76586.1 hypothetical protein HMPREF9718_00910 [Sphingobium yanoikuyae ATCC 51230]WQE05353.1 DUF938 domain-containing protein [Sphingobium yanoikuyae]SHL81181.1 Protein of unknown function [Sphingobium sp. YR657]
MTQDAPAPWTPQGDGPDPRRHAPATLRNRDAIATVLRDELPDAGLVLEVASGSGEHVVHFAVTFPALDWQPSDPDPAALASIAALRGDANLSNLRAPLLLDAASVDWPIDAADALLCINMVHISPWAATLGLLACGARLLAPGAPLILYGPYVEDDVPTAPSNLAFDRSLKDRNPQWGLRTLTDVDRAAACVGLARSRRVAMPANNLMLVYRRG